MSKLSPPARHSHIRAEKKARARKGDNMRKVTAGLFHSLDGVVERPDLWQFDSFDDELGAEMTTTLATIDTALMGRVGYSEWSQYWPNAREDLDFAGFINGVEKYVASETLTPDQLTWSNSKLIEGDFLDFVRTLKAGSGGDIATMASISLVRQLVMAGLMDELILITHPVVAGTGRHLFEPGDPTMRLEFVRGSITSKGNVIHTYRRKD
jgi:dihydrofolate reductase